MYWEEYVAATAGCLRLGRFLLSARLDRIFVTQRGFLVSNDSVCIILQNDPVENAARIKPPEPEFRLNHIVLLKKLALYSSLLCSYTLRRILETIELEHIEPASEYETFAFRIKDGQRLIRITSTGGRIPGHWVSDH